MLELFNLEQGECLVVSYDAEQIDRYCKFDVNDDGTQSEALA